MPLGGRFGYLFKNQIPTDQINTIAAHELGHGIWALKHTFDNDYGNIAVNTTENLMDYTPHADHLAKWQWEIIRYPALFTDPFGGDEEGMVISEAQFSSEIQKAGITVGEQHVFVAPSGQYIYLPKDNVASLAFVSLFDYVPAGSLVGFKLTDQSVWIATYNNRTTFNGYAKVINPDKEGIDKFKNEQGTIFYYEDPMFSILPDNTLSYLGFADNCKINFYTKPVNQLKEHSNKKSTGEFYFVTIPSSQNIAFSVADNSTCIPPPLNITFNELQAENIKMIYPYGESNGALYVYKQSNNIDFIYCNYNSEGVLYFYRYNQYTEQWEGWRPQTPQLLTQEDIFIATLSIMWEIGRQPHIMLAGISITHFPVISSAADLVDAAIYYAEGDNLSAGLSLVGAIPVVGESAKWLKLSNVFLKGRKLIKSADGFADAINDAVAALRQVNKESDALQLLETAGKLSTKYGDDVHRVLMQMKNAMSADKFADVVKAIDNLDDTKQAAFFNGLVKNTENLANNLNKLDDKLVSAWSKIYDLYPVKSFDINCLTHFDNIVSSVHFTNSGITETALMSLINGNRLAGAGAEELVQLLKGYEELVTSGTKFGDITKLISDLEKTGTGFAEGAQWVQRYIVNNADEFKGLTVTFEEIEDIVGSGIRRVDVVANAGGTSRKIFYEFKSVQNIPPQNFAKQFIKDLEIADDLDQIKWIFDGKKISALDKTKFLDELKKADIASDVIKKWTQEDDINKLFKLIEDNFNDIFLIK
jgi:hypothetical protein